MISLNLPSINFTDTEKAQQQAASSQMADLLKRTGKGSLYRTLTANDRKLLKNEGFAPDLVNNLVYVTQRSFTTGLGTHQDTLQLGFTDAAIDPSIYASEKVTQALQMATQGNCAFCDSHLITTGAGNVVQFRPPAALQTGDEIVRSPYADLAYDVSNLHYVCSACNDYHKQLQFPVSGHRYPQVKLAEESCLLLDPYLDDPDAFIGVNPLNAMLYPLDLLTQFFGETQGIASKDVKQYLINHPEQIPIVIENNTNQIHQSSQQPDFQKWATTEKFAQSRGFQTIALLGLNRNTLLFNRFSFLQHLFAQFSASQKEITCHEYRAAGKDAIATWSSEQDDKEQQPDWHKAYQQNPYSLSVDDLQTGIPNWLKSRLIYFVRESELSVQGKRRIVYLSDDDFIYGEDNPEKSLFLSINWSKDLHNVIKVRNKQQVWETSLPELAHSHPLEISKLFASNEIWAEGDYSALT